MKSLTWIFSSSFSFRVLCRVGGFLASRAHSLQCLFVPSRKRACQTVHALTLLAKPWLEMGGKSLQALRRRSAAPPLPDSSWLDGRSLLAEEAASLLWQSVLREVGSDRWLASQELTRTDDSCRAWPLGERSRSRCSELMRTSWRTSISESFIQS